MSIPIRKCGKSIVPAYLSKFRIKIAAEGEEEPADALQRQFLHQMNYAGPESGVPWKNRNRYEKERGLKLVNGLFGMMGELGAKTKGLFVNLNYGKEDPYFVSTYVNDIMKYHPSIKPGEREVYSPKSSVHPLDENHLYGLQISSLEELDELLCGKLDLELLKVAALAQYLGRPNQILEPNIFGDTGFLNISGEEAPEQELERKKVRLLEPDEYEKRLCKKLFELFGKKIRIAADQPILNDQGQPLTEEELAAIPLATNKGFAPQGLYWANIIDAFNLFSLNYSEPMKRYIYALCTPVLEKDGRDTILWDERKAKPNTARTASMRLRHAKYGDIKEAHDARKDSFAGRRKKNAKGADVREVMFIDLESIEDAWEDKTKGTLDRKFVTALQDIQKYARTEAHIEEQRKGVTEITEPRTIAFISKKPLVTQVQQDQTADIDFISRIEIDPVSLEEAQEIKLPYLMRSNLAGNVPLPEKVERPEKGGFLFRVPNEIGRHELETKDVIDRALKLLQEKRMDQFMVDLQAIVTNPPIQVKREAAYLGRLATGQLTPEKEVEIRDVLSTIKIKITEKFRYIDPWKRNEEGKLVSEDNEPIDLNSGKYAMPIVNNTFELNQGGNRFLFRRTRVDSQQSPVSGRWELVADRNKQETNPAVYFEFEYTGKGKEVFAAAEEGAEPDEYELSWKTTEAPGAGGKAQTTLLLTINAELPLPPAFSDEMNGKIAALAGISAKLSFKSLQEFVLNAMYKSAYRDEETRDLEVPSLPMDEHMNIVYGAVKEKKIVTRPDGKKVIEYIFKKGDKEYPAARAFVCDYHKMTRLMSAEYAEKLFDSVAGEHAGQIKQQFKIFTREQIEQPYIVSQRDLKEAISNFKYLQKGQGFLGALQHRIKQAGSADIEKTKQEFIDVLKEASAGEYEIEELLTMLRETEESWKQIDKIEDLQAVLLRFINNKKRNRFLLHGPPGTGKSSFAKHLAHILNFGCMQWNLESSASKWVGETEKFIYSAFSIVKSLRNYVLVLDEIDKVLGIGVGSSGSTDTSKESIKGAFQKEMDSLVDKAHEENIIKNNVILVSTTNYISNLAPEVQRRLTGVGMESGGTGAIYLGPVTDPRDISDIIAKEVLPESSLKPNPKQFLAELSKALSEKALAGQAFNPTEMIGLFKAWIGTATERMKNIRIAIEEKEKSPLGPSETPEQRAQLLQDWKARKVELTYGPKSIREMVSRTIPYSSTDKQSREEKSKFVFHVDTQYANSADFLLDIAGSPEVAPAPGIPTAPPQQQVPLWKRRQQPQQTQEPQAQEVAPPVQPEQPATPPPPAAPAIPAPPARRRPGAGAAYNRKNTRLGCFNRNKKRVGFGKG